MTKFRWGFVPGATPAKWARVWTQRHGETLELVPVAAAAAHALVEAGELDAALLRPPVNRDVLHAIPLYDELTVVLASRDHLFAALDAEEAIPVADLAHETVWWPRDDVLAWPEGLPGELATERPETTLDAIQLVAAGIGVCLAPLSLARLHHRKDVIYRPLIGGSVASVALAWRIDNEDPRMEDLVGIVRGRTVNSSRGNSSRGIAGAGGGTGDARSARQSGDSRGSGPSAARGRSARAGDARGTGPRRRTGGKPGKGGKNGGRGGPNRRGR